MGLEYTLIDAFTAKPFGGNPAVVFLLPEARDEEWMQAVASEMNQPETAFLVQADDGYNLRWFTPTVEIDLAGHATLASAHWLWTSGRLDPNTAARFHTRSGLLIAEKRDGWIRLDLPATPPIEQQPPEGLAEALGAEVLWAGKSPFDLLVEVASEEALRSLEPNLSAISRYPSAGSSSPPRQRLRPTTSSRDSSRPSLASTKTQSPAPRTVVWVPTGLKNSARNSCSPIRLRRAAECCGSKWAQLASRWKGKP